jgi:uncharacterized membrane protein YedE/YeeE
MTTTRSSRWAFPLLILGVVLPAALAFHSGLWVLTAVSIGLLFGFLLQKGDLCGAAAFSEVLLARDGSKVFGLWIAIVTAMCGFAVLELAGLVTLNPKPLIWVNYLVGGVLFGVGMVLAGGCVSGCLYKAGSGNLNSIAALLAIPVGIALVEYGPLHDWFVAAKAVRVTNGAGGSVTLSGVTGLPYGAIAALCAVGTVALVAMRRSRRRRAAIEGGSTPRERTAWLLRSWRPWQAGLAIGLLSVLAYLSSAASGRNYPLGVTHGVLHVQLLLTDGQLNHVYQKAPPVARPAAPEPADTTAGQAPSPRPRPKKVVWWLVLVVSSLVGGSFLSARMSGRARLLPRPPGQILGAIAGGLLVGTGAAIGTGCVIGNILSGWALLSVGSLLFGVVVVLANWVTTWLYLMGADRSAWTPRT